MPISPMLRGATGPPLQFAIQDDNLSPLNITGATMNPLIIKNVLTNVEQVGAGTWSIYNGTAGIAQYILNAADTATVGTYNLYISFSLSGLTYECDPIPWTINAR